MSGFSLSTSLNHVSDGIMITEASLRGPGDPKIIYVNRAIELMTGYRADELVGHTPRVLQCPETDRDALDRIRIALEAGRPITESVMNARKDGARHLVELRIVPELDVAGNPIRFISFHRNMTEQTIEQRRDPTYMKSFRLLFDENPTPMYVMECQHLRIIMVNDAWLRMTGYDRANALLLTGLDIRVASSPETLRNDIFREAHNQEPSGPHEIIGADHRPIIAMTMRRFITVDGQTGIINTLWDVSELESARTAMRETVQRLNEVSGALTTKTKELIAAQRLAKLGSWYWNLNERTINLSPETWQLLGRHLPEARISYDQMREMIHPEDYARTMDSYYRVVTEKVPVTAEYRVILPDGSIRELLTFAEPARYENQHVIEVRGTTQDISEIRTVESKLRASEDHYRNMVELHPLIPWTASPDGQVLDISAKWELLTGVPVEDALPDGWIRAVHEGDRDQVTAAWSQALTTLVPFDIEYRIRSARGTYRWVRARAAVRLDETGKPLRWYGTMEDITDHRHAEEARHRVETLSLRILDATSDAILVLDSELKINFANRIATQTFGSSSAIVGKLLHRALQIKNSSSLSGAITSSFRTQEKKDIEFFWRPADSWFEIHIRPDKSEISLFCRDISERKRAQRQLRHAARHDPLTGAPNRIMLFEYLEARLQATTETERIALFCLDLDFFKEINDTIGHPAGDTVLKLVVNRIRSCIRANDLLARAGGDEFMVVQTAVNSRQDVEYLAERIITTLKRPFLVDQREVQLGVSIGIAISGLGQRTAGEIYKQADLALYTTKTLRRGSYQFFEPSMDDAFKQANEIRSDLLGAVARNELSLVFQPILRTMDLMVVGAEALARWLHPERGNVPPDRFIPIAEETGCIIEIGEWVLREACRVAVTWPEHISLSVNVSPKQISQPNFHDVVADILATAGLPADRLLLEITETIFFSSSTTIRRTLQELMEMGVRMVLDDFGTGYSSLSYLDSFEFQKIKIDRSFITKISDAKEPMPILEAIMGLSRGLALTVTAEGIETEAQLEYLKLIGCQEVQGYLLGRPMPEREFTKRISDQANKLMPREAPAKKFR